MRIQFYERIALFVLLFFLLFCQTRMNWPWWQRLELLFVVIIFISLVRDSTQKLPSNKEIWKTKMKKNRTRRNSQPKTTKKKKKNEKKARAANIRVHEFEHFFFFVSVFLSFDEFLLWLPFEPHSFVCCLTLEIALKIRSQKKKKKNEKKVMVNN